MSRQNYVNKLNQAINERIPYAYNVAEAMTKMTPEQQNYFCDVVMPYYMDGPGYDQYGGFYKTMEYMGRAVQQNKDVSQILGIDFRQIGAKLSTLPDISQIQTQTQSASQQQVQPNNNEYEKQKMITEMRELVDKYVTHRGSRMQGIESGSFAQTNHIEPSNYNVATQGWKFHISANDLSDYKRLLETAVPEFDRLGVHYKVVTPERFEAQCQSNQAGKAITIYPNASFDMNQFSQELRNVLAEPSSIEPIGDAQIFGRIYARYGTFRGNPKEVIAQDGSRHLDGRHREIAPEFVGERTGQDVLNFYSDAARRYNETGDFKTYLQESATMTRGIDGNHAFVTLAVDMNNFGRINGVVGEDPTNSSFIYKMGNEYYAMIHNDFAGQAFNLLNERGINCIRPEWDCRYNLYEIYPDDISNACSFVNDSPFMDWKQLENGNYAVQVDTAFNRQFEEQCQCFGVRVASLAINVPEIEIENQLEMSQDAQVMMHDFCD